ncbi:MAG: hypothetical protein OSJ21_07890, partial [Paramuribaculum intestinale]|nr:hypothetical protein [Paramuribaculum intestinale]
ILKLLLTELIVFDSLNSYQFTIDCEIPSNSIKFKIKHPEKISEDDILDHLGYNREWVEIL